MVLRRGARHAHALRRLQALPEPGARKEHGPRDRPRRGKLHVRRQRREVPGLCPGHRRERAGPQRPARARRHPRAGGPARERQLQHGELPHHARARGAHSPGGARRPWLHAVCQRRRGGDGRLAEAGARLHAQAVRHRVQGLVPRAHVGRALRHRLRRALPRVVPAGAARRVLCHLPAEGPVPQGHGRAAALQVLPGRAAAAV